MTFGQHPEKKVFEKAHTIYVHLHKQVLNVIPVLLR